MIGKCSNPECNAEFRYASRGRLYSFEVRNPRQPCHDVPPAICERKPSHATVNFWLCDNCCARFSLQFSIHTGLMVVPKRIAAAEKIAGQAQPARSRHTA